MRPQEVVQEPPQSRAEEAEPEGGKSAGGPSADVRAGRRHRHRGQDERCGDPLCVQLGLEEQFHIVNSGWFVFMGEM